MVIWNLRLFEVTHMYKLVEINNKKFGKLLKQACVQNYLTLLSDIQNTIRNDFSFKLSCLQKICYTKDSTHKLIPEDWNVVIHFKTFFQRKFWYFISWKLIYYTCFTDDNFENYNQKKKILTPQIKDHYPPFC